MKDELLLCERFERTVTCFEWTRNRFRVFGYLNWTWRVGESEVEVCLRNVCAVYCFSSGWMLLCFVKIFIKDVSIIKMFQHGHWLDACFRCLFALSAPLCSHLVFRQWVEGKGGRGEGEFIKRTVNNHVFTRLQEKEKEEEGLDETIKCHTLISDNSVL